MILTKDGQLANVERHSAAVEKTCFSFFWREVQD
jgi:hypothetical protein